MFNKVFMIAVCAINLVAPICADQNSNSKRCHILIDEPKQGDTLAGQVNATGSAVVPAGKHLWIFAHRRGVALWWPQGGGPAQVESGKWASFVTLGLERDSGAQFEIIAVILDQRDHNDMLQVVSRYEERHEYPGVKLPPPALACAPVKVIVNRR